jgi:hypothetical protein
MLIDRNAPGDGARIEALMAAAKGTAAEIGMQREIVRLERLSKRMTTVQRAAGI